MGLGPPGTRATYVTTDSLCLGGGAAGAAVPFEVLHRDEQILCGSLVWAPPGRHAARGAKAGGGGGGGGEGDVPGPRWGWHLDAACTVGRQGCVFLKARHDYTTPLTYPTLEVCVVGRCSAVPVVLADTVKLTARRKNVRKAALDAIQEEDDESDRADDGASSPGSSMDDEAALDTSLSAAFAEKSPAAYGGYYDLHGHEHAGYADGDDGELSWFNAGVRVGVGLGLGMCLGLGIGVGLMVRTYQTTARTLRRSFF
eukprot:SM000174S03350  [mRNA]  locus=s174:140342:141775:- [translate_table: standard]